MRNLELKNNANVAHNWAHGTGKMTKGSSFYYDNNEVIYSFGNHFPIARRISNSLYYYTLQTWSGSYTSRHKSATSQAIPDNATVVYMRYIAVDEKCTIDHVSNLQYWLGELTTARRVYNDARVKTKHIHNIQSIFNLINEYCATFAIACYDTVPTLTELYQWFKSIDIQTILETEGAKDKERIAKREAKELRLQTEAVSMFHNFEIKEMPHGHGNATLLRYNKKSNNVETSKGIKIPLDLAKRLYNTIMSKLSNGGCNDCKVPVYGSYHIDTITDSHIIAGCHNIRITEIQACYEAMTA